MYKLVSGVIFDGIALITGSDKHAQRNISSLVRQRTTTLSMCTSTHVHAQRNVFIER